MTSCAQVISLVSENDGSLEECSGQEPPDEYASENVREVNTVPSAQVSPRKMNLNTDRQKLRKLSSGLNSIDEEVRAFQSLYCNERYDLARYGWMIFVEMLHFCRKR